MIKKIFSIDSKGQSTELDASKLLFITHDNREIEVDINNGPNQADFTLLANSCDCSKKEFQQFLLYPGASNLISVKLWFP